MRHIATTTSALALLAMLAAPTALLAQPPGGGQARNYDPRTVEIVEGTVRKLDHVAHGGRSSGVHLVLETAKGPLAVHLGPSWYLDEQKVHVDVGDRVRIQGSRVEVDGAPALIAREVTKDGTSLVLRDPAGRPAWAGRGRGGPPR